MIVVDASTMVHALVNTDAVGDRCRARITGRQKFLEPHHFRIEVMSAIRRGYLGREITEESAAAALEDLHRFNVRYPPRPVEHIDRIWQLRHNLTAYDAAYVALAEARGCALVTADARLAGAPGLRCEVVLATAA
ncbi:MAG: type II toxin-antitoxin system VapC family toxin [Sporichthyaceae bacterium]